MCLDEKLFPIKLKECRKQMNMLQSEFAKMMGYTTQYISCLETSRRRPSMSFLLQLSLKTKRPVSFFYSSLQPLSNRDPSLFDQLCEKDEGELRRICIALEAMCFGNL